MKLPASAVLPRLPLPAGERPALPATPGTRLQGEVIRGEDARLAVRVGRLTLPLPRGADMAAGERLTLQVTEDRGRLALEIVARRREAPPAETSALRRHQPRQQPLGEALRALAAALRAAPARSEAGTAAAAGPQPLTGPGALAPPVRQAAEALLAALPSPRTLADAEGLRTALRDSGVLLEPLLARTPPQRVPELAGQDVKALLARFADRVRGQLAATGGADTTVDEGLQRQLLELARGSEAALSRLALLQLQPGQGGEANRLDLAFELLVNAQGELDTLNLRLRGPLDEERDGQGGEGPEEDDWSVDVTLAFADGDRLEARLWLGTEGLGVHWWSESEALRARLESMLPALQARLEAAGLAVATLEAWPGRPRQPADRITPPAGGVLNERA